MTKAAGKDLSDKVYELFETATSSGKVRKGTNEVTKALERETAKLVAIAEDVNPPAIVAHLPLLSKEKKVPFIVVPSRKELGASVGLKVGCASAALVNEGSARNLFKEVKETVLALNKSESV